MRNDRDETRQRIPRLQFPRMSDHTRPRPRHGPSDLPPRLHRRGGRRHRRRGAGSPGAGRVSRRCRPTPASSAPATITRRPRSACAAATTARSRRRTACGTAGCRSTRPSIGARPTTWSSSAAASAGWPRRITSAPRPARRRASWCSTTTTTSAATPSATSSPTTAAPTSATAAPSRSTARRRTRPPPRRSSPTSASTSRATQRVLDGNLYRSLGLSGGDLLRPGDLRRRQAGRRHVAQSDQGVPGAVAARPPRSRRRSCGWSTRSAT